MHGGVLFRRDLCSFAGAGFRGRNGFLAKCGWLFRAVLRWRGRVLAQHSLTVVETDSKPVGLRNPVTCLTCLQSSANRSRSAERGEIRNPIVVYLGEAMECDEPFALTSKIIPNLEQSAAGGICHNLQALLTFAENLVTKRSGGSAETMASISSGHSVALRSTG